MGKKSGRDDPLNNTDGMKMKRAKAGGGYGEGGTKNAKDTKLPSPNKGIPGSGGLSGKPGGMKSKPGKKVGKLKG